MARPIFLNRYEVIHLLGEGGMGKVLLARQLDSDRQVVVKVMHDKVARQPRFRENFQHEMQFMARFQHPNVVALLDASVNGPDGPCIVMEYIDGIDLEQLLRQHGPLDQVRVGRLLGQLCAALHAAHSRGIVHRDLKLANVMIMKPDTPEETVKVMDFGLSKLSDTLHIDLSKFDDPDAIIAKGTPEYMAPEQIRGDDLDHRGDLYSVGVMLYELLTGRLPFRRPSTLQLLKAHVEEPPPSFASIGCTWVRRDVEKVVLDCLAKYPVERPQSARDLALRYEVALGEKVLADNLFFDAGATMKARVEDMPLTAPPEKEPEPDPTTVVHHLEAWMPERIAVMKLRGWVQDAGGEVVESVPGMIRVRLGGGESPYRLPRMGLMARLGLVRNAGLIEVQLHMHKKDPTQQQLNITVVLTPAVAGKLTAQIVQHPDWPIVCDRVFRDLRSYLMGK
jgi:serine/threonine-protein kinase